MHQYICQNCGAHLDPGETCDCQRRAEAQPEKHVVTYSDWEAAGDFDHAAKPGDYVEEKIVEEFVNCVPPACLKSGFAQCGEPFSHERDDSGHFRPTYQTFVRKGTHWTYCGHCFYDDTVNRPIKNHVEREDQHGTLQ